MASSPSAFLASPAKALQIAASAKVVAVLGARTDHAARTRPAFFVPETLHNDGVEVIPVPVKPEPGNYPGGAKPLASLAELKERSDVDVLCCFRKPEDLPTADEILRSGPPRCLWLQSGIRCPELERAVAERGDVVVVADRCIKVDRAAAKEASKM